ncbi:MAG: thrombospondin type 3 repeat-containing protein [Bacteroidota bacterium]|jgi:hypothetical protein
MRTLLCLSFLLLSIFGFGQTKDANYYFIRASRAYVKNTDSVCIYIKEGLRNYPNSGRLQALAQKAQCVMGKPDRDNDGVPDAEDNCPDKRGVRSNNGCPKPKDSDNDGVPDSQDNCPDVYGEKSSQGCPGGGGNPQPPGPSDRDGDGVNDAQDNCPDEKGLQSNNGCPKSQPPLPPKDKDNDGIPDSEDNCPTQRGTRANYGCPEEPPKPPGPIEVDVKLRRGSGNTIEWSSELTQAAEEIRITFHDEDNDIDWVKNKDVSGRNLFTYNPRDGRAGGVETTVTLNIKLKKGYKMSGSAKLTGQYFSCSSDE